MSRPERVAGLTTLIGDATLRRGRARSPERLRGAARTSERDSLRRRLLGLADAVTGAVGGAIVAAGAGLSPAAGLLLVPLWILLAKVHGLYDRDHRALRHLTVDEAPTIIVWTMAATAATALLLVPLASAGADASTIAAAWLCATACAFGLRAAARSAWRRSTPPERTVILGEGAPTHAARRKLQLFPDIHVVLLDQPELDLDGLRELDELPGGVDRIILASPEIDEGLIVKLVALCRESGVKLTVVPPARTMLCTAVELRHVADLPVIEYNTWDVSRSTLQLKRLLDVVVAAVALVVLAPLFAASAIAVASTRRDRSCSGSCAPGSAGGRSGCSSSAPWSRTPRISSGSSSSSTSCRSPCSSSRPTRA